MKEKYFDPNGRIGRADYIFIVILLFVATLISGVIPLFGIFYLILLVITFIQGAKRCHDLGHSGFFQLIPFYFFVMLIKKGQSGENSFGDDPEKLDNEENEDSVFCQYCNQEVELDETEKSQNKFKCPECFKENILQLN